MRRIYTALLCLSLASMSLRGEAQDRGEQDPEETAGVPTNRSALGEALGSRFASCYAAESGPLSPADLSTLRDMLTPRAVAVAESAGAQDCEAASNQAACVDALTNVACDRLARILGDSPSGSSAAPSWAAGYAHVLVQRITDCYVAEADGGTLGEARETLARFERETANALGTLAEREECHVDVNLLPACSTAVTRLSCDALGSRLANDPGSLLHALGDACKRLVACEGDGDAGLDLDAAMAITP